MVRCGSHVRVPAVVGESRIGVHDCRVVGDMIEIAARGEITEADVDAMQALVVEVRTREGQCYMLVDLAGMTGLNAAARRKVATWGQSKATRLTASAVYGCSFAMRALITLTRNAIRVLSAMDIDMTFVSDEAKARAWLAAYRVERARTGA